MPEFKCRLGTPSGEIVTRTVEADSAEQVRAKMVAEGLKVFSVTGGGKGIASRLSGSQSQGSKIKQADFLLFNQQLSALLKSGIPILQAIGLLRARSQSASLKKILTDVEEKVESGVSLSAALEAQNTFPKIYTASILAGEQAGALDSVLARYVEYLKKSVGVSRKLRSALAYPMFLLAASAMMVAFLTLYVVPRMSELFKGLNSRQGLPTVTYIVLGISSWLAGNIWWLLPLAIIGGFFLLSWLRTSNGRLALDRTLLRVPLGGTLITQLATAQLARSLSTLLAGGITVPDAWDIASQAIGNAELRSRSSMVSDLIREGRGFTEALSRSGWLPELALDMIGIGEGSGSLREMLDEVANFYDAESEVRLEQLMTLLEPVILVVMALIVVAILLAIYLPIIQTISAGPFTGGSR